jgi:hypothetical protein
VPAAGNLPGLASVTSRHKPACRMLLNGDASQWDRALQMPHYNARAMPAISFHTGVHLVQWARSGRFTLYDYGSAALNRWVLGTVCCVLHPCLQCKHSSG